MNKKILTIGIISLILDQISKIVIDGALKINDTIEVIKGFFNITRLGNTGAAFSILEGRTLILIILSLVTVVMLIKYMGEFKNSNLSSVSFGLLIGGILGNLADRLFLGYVRDFLSFNIFGYNFPVFNLADTFIVVGVLLLIICMFRGDDKFGSSSK